MTVKVRDDPLDLARKVDHTNFHSGTFNVQFLLMMLWRDLSLDTKILAKGAGHVLTEDEMDTFYRKPVIDFPNVSCIFLFDIHIHTHTHTHTQMTSQEDVIETEVRPKLIPLSFARVEFKHGPPIKDGDLGILSVRKVAGTFLEQFELKSFPVDMQKLHIIARPTEDTRAIMLRQFPSPFSKEVKPDTKLPPLRNHISPFARNVEPGWEFHYLTTFETLDTKSMSRAYSTVEFNLILVRRPQYYINQYYFCVLASQFFALMLFGTPPTVTDRFENLIGLLLTIIALSFSMSENVPKVPYHTLLDKFMNHSVYVLIVMGLETFLLTISMESEWITDSDAEKIDLTCGILLCVFWVVMILGHHVYIARRTMYVNNSYSRFCDTMWLLNGCKDSFDMFDEADQKGTQRRKSKVISNIVDWIMKSNEQIQKDSTLRKNMARFRSTLRSPDPSKAEIPILKNDSDMECLTRVKNACVYFSGTLKMSLSCLSVVLSVL